MNWYVLGVCSCVWVCAGVCGSVLVCAGVHWFVRVCLDMRRCARACTSVQGYVGGCVGVFRCTGMHRCMCGMNFQNAYWRLESYSSADFNTYPIRIFSSHFLY